MDSKRPQGRDFIARHGETVFNAARRLQGEAAHTPLTRAGFAQAEEMGSALRAALGAATAADAMGVADRACVADAGGDRRTSRA